MSDYEAICFWCGNKFVYRCFGKSWVDADYSVCDECAKDGNFTKIVNEATGNTPQKSKLPAEVINEFIKQGQLSCAAGPWTYRTDTGDEHGKVYWDDKLPEKKVDGVLILIIISNLIAYKMGSVIGFVKGQNYALDLMLEAKKKQEPADENHE